jgi:arylsulfatase A-like enzyme
MYSELIDIPLLIYGAGESSYRDGVVSNIDISPTILHLFGIESHPSFKGQSLLPASKYVERCAFGEAIDQKSVKGGDISKDVYFCRMGDMKLIYRPNSQSLEVYDLKKDPGELNNIAGQPGKQINGKQS